MDPVLDLGDRVVERRNIVVAYRQPLTKIHHERLSRRTQYERASLGGGGCGGPVAVGRRCIAPIEAGQLVEHLRSFGFTVLRNGLATVDRASDVTVARQADVDIPPQDRQDVLAVD